jgi:hypothetical protein
MNAEGTCAVEYTNTRVLAHSSRGSTSTVVVCQCYIHDRHDQRLFQKTASLPTVSANQHFVFGEPPPDVGEPTHYFRRASPWCRRTNTFCSASLPLMSANQHLLFGEPPYGVGERHFLFGEPPPHVGEPTPSFRRASPWCRRANTFFSAGGPCRQSSGCDGNETLDTTYRGCGTTAVVHQSPDAFMFKVCGLGTGTTSSPRSAACTTDVWSCEHQISGKTSTSSPARSTCAKP